VAAPPDINVSTASSPSPEDLPRNAAELLGRERDLPNGVGELRACWKELPATLPLWPETGTLLGLGRAATFRAAARGDLPVVTLGRRKLALTVPLLKMLGLDLDRS
jgi:hypothetical protein